MIIGNTSTKEGAESRKDKGKIEGKTFLFITGSSGRENLMVKIGKKLSQEYSADCHFLSLATGRTKDFFLSEGVGKEQVTTITRKTKTPNLNFLKEKEELYNFRLFDLWQTSAPRRKNHLKIKYEQVLGMFEPIIKEIESAIEKIRPDYAFMTGISSYVYVITYKILIKKNIPVLELANARIPKRFIFDNKLKSEWPLLVKNYQKIKKEGLTAVQKKEAEQFLSAFLNKPFKPDDSAKVKEPFSKKIERFRQYARTLSYRRELPDLRPYFWFPLKDRILKYSSRFEEPQKGEKFVFYPLQIQPEASTSIRGKWHSNQIALIENIARSLPCNYKLYVKEHVKNYSKRPLYFHSEIKKHPNVRLISPLANTIKLIKESSLILTITGTVGWEAILMQKPIITFGEIFYNNFDEVIKANDYSQLPAIIKKSLERKVDYQKTLEFIFAMLSSTFFGVGALPGDCQNRSITKENITNIIHGIKKHIEQLNL